MAPKAEGGFVEKLIWDAKSGLKTKHFSFHAILPVTEKIEHVIESTIHVWHIYHSATKSVCLAKQW